MHNERDSQPCDRDPPCAVNCLCSPMEEFTAREAWRFLGLLTVPDFTLLPEFAL